MGSPDDYDDANTSDIDDEAGSTEDTIMPDPPGVETQADGSAIVSLDEEEGGGQANDDLQFYDNLVPDLMMLDGGYLDTLALDLIQKVKEDEDSHKKRNEMYKKGIQRTGLGEEAPGGATFNGASRATHPMLTQAAIDFEARAIKEIFPAAGPVKVEIQGTKTRKRVEKAERVARCMNWQCTKQIKELRPGLEKGLMQASLNGDSYLFWSYSKRYKRTTVVGAPGDKVIIPAAAMDFYSAERITFYDDIVDMVFRDRIREGVYYFKDEETPARPSQTPDESGAQEARNRVQGKDKTGLNQDGERRILVINTFLSGIEGRLGADGTDDEAMLPYLVHIDESTHKTIGLYRNWEEEDQLQERMDWISEIPFILWEEGGIGLNHAIGGLAAGATGALRALLDSAHVNNIPTAAILKGSGVGGQTKILQPTQIVELNNPVGTDDIRKLVMQMPYNEPSSVLYNLLGFLVEAGQGVVRTTFENLSTNNSNMPVGTTYALIEQGLQVVSAIMGRQHYAMQRMLGILFRINRMYLEEEAIRDEAGEVLAYKRDFQGPMDVVPVSDPGIPSDAHRFAQTQAIAQRADLKPQLYQGREVELEILKRLKVAEPERFLVSEQKTVEMNAANENLAATLGRPIQAFPEQDHVAHLQAHIDYMSNPLFGFSPLMATDLIPGMLAHIKEHMALWYVSNIFEHVKNAVSEVLGPLSDDDMVTQYMAIKDDNVRKEIDKIIALASEDVLGQDNLKPLLGMQVLQVAQQANKILAQYAPPPPMDPSQASLKIAQIDAGARDNQVKSQERQTAARLQVQQGKDKMHGALQVHAQESRTSEIANKEEGEDRRLAVAEAADSQRAREANFSREAIAQRNNNTALEISEAEIESGKSSDRSTGNDSSPGG